MAVSITIRNVPAAVRDELAARAAGSGRSLQEYLLDHLIEVTSQPTVEEVVRRARQRVALTGRTLERAAILSARDADRR